MNARAATFALLLLAPAALGQDAFVRTRSEPHPDVCIAWQTRDFTYRVSSAGSTATPRDAEFAAIDASFATWQAAAGGCNEFRFIRGERTTNTAIGYVEGGPNENLVIFQERQCEDVPIPEGDACHTAERPHSACATKYQCWYPDAKHSDFTFAATLTTYRVKSGNIVDADVEFNAARHQNGTPTWLFTTVNAPRCDPDRVSVDCVAIDIQNTMTHEIGHALGFEHSRGAPGSTMASSAEIGDTDKRVLDHATAEGFCGTYPRGLPPVLCDTLGTSQGGQSASKHVIGIASGSGCDAAGGLPSALALLLTLGGLRRRRRA
jgi:uncharacterized protein (TIGR03382 family)